MPDTTQFGDIEDNFSEATLKPNTVLISRYRIIGELGGGGQGAVYQARDLNFPEAKRLVAIKEMHYPSADPNQRSATFKTFQREANILATLAHPAIPKIFDFFDQNSRAYLVMEYINGSDLEVLLTKTKELPIDKIMEWASELCDVLDYLHGQQPEPIIFRDIKPANIMVDSRGNVRLIDFGIAKKFVSGTKHTMIGTEGYSAPEQYRGDVNPLSDVYSLGATLHHIITREDPRLAPPFSFNERPIKDYNSSVPSGFVEIINRALEMEPSKRFQSCAQMKEAILKVRYGGGGGMIAVNGTDDGSPKGTELFPNMENFGIEARWTFKTEDEIRASPTGYRNYAFVGSYDTNVWAVDLTNGEFAWKFPTQGGIASSPVMDTSSKLVLFGSEDHTFNAVDFSSGRINWSYTTKGRIRGTPRVAHDHVFFGSDDGRIYALVAANGRYLWEYDMGEAVRSRPFVTNELVIAGSDSGEVVALELSGNKKWGFRAKRGVMSSPIVDDQGICFFGSFDGHMYAIDSGSGYSMWRFRTTGPIVSSPAILDDLVYFGSTDGHFYAINAESSREKWKFNAESPIVSSPVIYKDNVYFGSNDGKFHCLDTNSGKEKWVYETKGAITAAAHIMENVILVGSTDNSVYALPLID
ncbi:MAG: serine/threonine-protein kinase [Aggregatilineales bacterium]